MQLANVNEAVLLLILDQVELESVRLLLDVIVRLLQLSVQLLVLVGPVFFLLEDLAVVLILVRHLLGFLSQFG